MQPSPGLYVHLPWCIKKCPYCDFNSHAVRDKPPYNDYVDAICADLEHQVSRYAPHAFGSVFFGGGTPSLFGPKQIGNILDCASNLSGIESDAEVTLEANPGAIEHGSFKGYRAVGINRISLGIQSFANAQLSALGRIHSADDARHAVESIHAANIAQLNLDLMYGLPEQTLDMALNDVNVALSLNPTHLSHYHLTIEPNTLFAVNTPTLPDSDACFDMQLACQQQLARAGFDQYEVSAYAKKGYRGKHNLNYWRFGDYLGIGAGAHGKITFGSATRRTQKPKHPTQYLREPLSVVETNSSSEDLVFEFMLNRLRLDSPITLNEISKHQWLNSTAAQTRFKLASDRGLLALTAEGAWQKTALGTRFLNDVQEIFLP